MNKYIGLLLALLLPGMAHAGFGELRGPARAIGVTDGSNAPAGLVGEIVSSSLGSIQDPGATGIFIAISTITLTPGDWDISGTGEFDGGGTTAGTDFSVGISTKNYAMDVFSANNAFFLSSTLGANAVIQAPCGPRRVSITTSTSYYLMGRVAFTVLGGGKWQTSSTIRARRVR